jgi:flagellar FliJ protein
MKRFRFQLEPLLKLRRHREEAAQRALAETLRAVEAQRGRIRNLENEREEMLRLAEQEAEYHPGKRQDVLIYLANLRRRLEEAGRELESLEQAVKRRRLELEEAAKARKALEQLRDRRREDFRGEQLRREYSEVDEAVLQRRRLLPVLLLGAVPVFSLTVSVTDFRLDFSGLPADTLQIDPGFGDSLLIGTRAHQLRRVLTQTLNNGSGRNGASAASPSASMAGAGRFEVGYLAWTSPHSRVDGGLNPPPADIVSRSVLVADETTYVAASARLLAAAENYPDTSNPRRFYSGLNIRPPPSYFNFFAADSNYLGYWGTLSIRGSVRRTTHQIAAGGGLPETWGRYVPPVSPVVLEAYGKIGAGARPGSRAQRAVLAYETTVAANNYGAQVRFEDAVAGTSQAVSFSRTELPEEFAVAVDSAGNALVLWRQGNVLFLAGYDSARNETRSPLQVQTPITYRDGTLEHNYRPYGAAALYNGRFIAAYIGPAGRVVYRMISLPHAGSIFSMGAETLVSAAGQSVLFPSV